MQHDKYINVLSKIFDYKINADLNKNVFNLDLKIAKEGLSRIYKGKLFHSLGAAC